MHESGTFAVDVAFKFWIVDKCCIFDAGHDDFDGAALQGRIAVALAGAPPGFAPEARAFHASVREKQAEVAARGAVGLVLVGDPQSEARSPWAQRADSWKTPRLQLLGAGGVPVDAPASLQAQARVSAAAAEVLFAGAPMEAAQVFAARAAGTRLPAFALPGTALLAGSARVQRIDSVNVLGRIAGSDPALVAEPLLFTAHLDHLGSATGGSGDRIHNGAIDNALGVAVLLDSARRLAAAPPRRPLLFAALTAEEHGLLGALHLAAQPPGAVAPIANLNIDMPVLLGPQRAVVAIGAGHSGLGPLAARAAASVGMLLGADPFPQQGAFLRSDQYAFVRAGIPALYLTATASGSEGSDAPRQQLAHYLQQHYHRPGDDLGLPIDYAGAARLAAFAVAESAGVDDPPALPRQERRGPGAHQLRRRQRLA